MASGNGTPSAFSIVICAPIELATGLNLGRFSGFACSDDNYSGSTVIISFHNKVLGSICTLNTLEGKFYYYFYHRSVKNEGTKL